LAALRHLFIANHSLHALSRHFEAAEISIFSTAASSGSVSYKFLSLDMSMGDPSILKSDDEML